MFKKIELEKNNNFQLESLEVGLTSQCNFHCEYCCAYHKNDKAVLTGDQVIEIIRQIPTLKRLKLSGGEVLLYFADCLKIIAYCAEKGIKTQINSNGSLLDQEQLGLLRQNGLDTLHISLNFTNAQEHDAYYKMGLSVFAKIIDNITEGVRQNLNLMVETILFETTEKRITELYNYIYALGVRHMELQYGISIDHSGWNKTIFKEKVNLMITEIINCKKPDSLVYFSCLDLADYPTFREQEEELKKQGIFFPRCIEGKKQLHLHSNGDILICELGYPVVLDNLFANPGAFVDIYSNKMPEKLTDFISQHPCRKNAW